MEREGRRGGTLKFVVKKVCGKEGGRWGGQCGGGVRWSEMEEEGESDVEQTRGVSKGLRMAEEGKRQGTMESSGKEGWVGR